MNKPNMEPVGINDDPMAAERELRLAELTRQALDEGFQAVEVALGPDGVRALIEERNTAQARVKELEGRMRRCEDCDATMNHIGNGIFECWKCTEAETRAQLVEAQSLRKDVNDAFQSLRAAGLMAGVRPVTVSNLVAKLIAERDSLCGQVDDAVAQLVKANAKAEARGEALAKELADFKRWIDKESAFLSKDDLVATLVERAEAAEAQAATFKEALNACDVVMDTAATHGVGDILPPAYRDSWARAHMGAQAALAPETKEGE